MIRAGTAELKPRRVSGAGSLRPFLVGLTTQECRDVQQFFLQPGFSEAVAYGALPLYRRLVERLVVGLGLRLRAANDAHRRLGGRSL